MKDHSSSGGPPSGDDGLLSALDIFIAHRKAGERTLNFDAFLATMTDVGMLRRSSHGSREMLFLLFEHLDVDGDNSLDFGEFVFVFPDIVKVLRSDFDELDRDGDGVLGYSDLEEVFLPHQSSILVETYSTPSGLAFRGYVDFYLGGRFSKVIKEISSLELEPPNQTSTRSVNAVELGSAGARHNATEYGLNGDTISVDPTAVDHQSPNYINHYWFIMVVLCVVSLATFMYLFVMKKRRPVLVPPAFTSALRGNGEAILKSQRVGSDELEPA